MSTNEPELQSVLDHLNMAVLVFDRELHLTMINPSGEALLSISVRKAIGLHADKLFLGDNYWIDVLDWARNEKLAFSERAVTLPRAVKDPANVDVTVTPLMDGSELEGLLVEIQQVDRRTQIVNDEYLLAQHATAHAVIRGLAHEIRNPLGGLRGAAQLLEKEISDPSLKEYTDVIIGEADRLQTLLDRMLGPRGLPRKRMVNIHEVTGRVCQLIQAESDDGLSLVCDYDPSIPEVYADPDLLIQAVLNVARNALQAIEGQGRVTVRTRVIRHFTIGHKQFRLAIKLDIMDTGPGIDEDMLETIFYPMVSGRPDGTGLGLSIAQDLVQKHGGLIHCKSSPGETTMSIILPLEIGE